MCSGIQVFLNTYELDEDSSIDLSPPIYPTGTQTKKLLCTREVDAATQTINEVRDVGISVVLSSDCTPSEIYTRGMHEKTSKVDNTTCLAEDALSCGQCQRIRPPCPSIEADDTPSGELHSEAPRPSIVADDAPVGGLYYQHATTPRATNAAEDASHGELLYSPSESASVQHNISVPRASQENPRRRLQPVPYAEICPLPVTDTLHTCAEIECTLQGGSQATLSATLSVPERPPITSMHHNLNAANWQYKLHAMDLTSTFSDPVESAVTVPDHPIAPVEPFEVSQDEVTPWNNRHPQIRILSDVPVPKELYITSLFPERSAHTHTQILN
ncbi:hypothetical protein QAD02_007854 [Eretmocerus hayati]|uniref:Uncharacterized protein n=1 Tax=Eretmocerus hayati TaxID=131215 RepID=A0ACC2N788_9HYME|nr:hypothetical protein QAD02_007854 [Eretmocerus hayati]